MKLAVLVTLISSTTAFMAPSLHSSRSRNSFLRETVEEEETSTFQGSEAISSLTKDVSTVFTSEDIANTLPHRYPFALVDKVVEYEVGKVRLFKYTKRLEKTKPKRHVYYFICKELTLSHFTSTFPAYSVR